MRVYGQYLTVLLSVLGDSTILAHFRAKNPSERMLTLFCNENFKHEAGFGAGVANLSVMRGIFYSMRANGD